MDMPMRNIPSPRIADVASCHVAAAAAHRPRCRPAHLTKAVAIAEPSLDAYTQLEVLSDASGYVTVAETARGRGLVAKQDLAEREPLLAVPLQHALLIADDPIGGISIFSDRQHRKWQQVHGELPTELLEFLQGDARWDARMAAWLLWMRRHTSPLWRSYLSLLPAEPDMSCLLNFSRDEIAELQLPSLKDEARIQADWCAHLHGKYFDARTGSLASLGLSSSLTLSLWAIGLVRSRTFSEDVNGEALTLMVPVCDMANHCDDYNSTFCLSKDNKSFTLRSLRALSPGEEVTITYGADKPNCDLMRDYGFILSGNEHDRISFPSSSSSSSGDKSKAGVGSSGTAAPGLNAACLLEAAGFAGDLTTGDIAPTPELQQYQTQQQWMRRKAALLSMPLQQPSGRSIGGWLAAATQPWTEAGRPAPQPLRRDQGPAERAAVQQLQKLLAQQLAALPTSIDTDQQLLCSTSSSPETATKGDSVQQRRRQRLQQQSSQAVQQVAGMADSMQASSSRVMAAVRARLEHKLLLREAFHVLQQYDRYLVDRFGAA